MRRIRAGRNRVISATLNRKSPQWRSANVPRASLGRDHATQDWATAVRLRLRARHGPWVAVHGTRVEIDKPARDQGGQETRTEGGHPMGPGWPSDGPRVDITSITNKLTPNLGPPPQRRHPTEV